MSNVVYTINSCPYCVMVKNLLSNLNVEFEERLVTSREEMMQLKARFRWSTFPMVVINGKFIGGYDDTQALADLGELNRLLGR